MSTTVFTARSMVRKFDHAVCNRAFYDLLECTLDERLHESYLHGVSREVVSFPSFDAFVASPDGLGAKDAAVLEAAMQAVAASETNPQQDRAQAILRRILTLRLQQEARNG